MPSFLAQMMMPKPQPPSPAKVAAKLRFGSQSPLRAGLQATSGLSCARDVQVSEYKAKLARLDDPGVGLEAKVGGASAQLPSSAHHAL